LAAAAAAGAATSSFFSATIVFETIKQSFGSNLA
jgi:hypothetical protein